MLLRHTVYCRRSKYIYFWKQHTLSQLHTYLLSSTHESGSGHRNPSETRPVNLLHAHDGDSFWVVRPRCRFKLPQMQDDPSPAHTHMYTYSRRQSSVNRWRKLTAEPQLMAKQGGLSANCVFWHIHIERTLTQGHAFRSGRPGTGGRGVN